MLKRFLGIPLCLVLLGFLLVGCNFSVHAKDAGPVKQASSALPVVDASAVSSASPVVDATASSSDTPVADATADTPVADASAVAPAQPVQNPPVRSAPAPSGFPALIPDDGMSVAYRVVGYGAKTVTGRFPAAAGFSLHIYCRGQGLISVEISNGTFNTESCPRLDDSGNYYYSYPAPGSFYTIQVRTQGPVTWRVVVENQI